MSSSNFSAIVHDLCLWSCLSRLLGLVQRLRINISLLFTLTVEIAVKLSRLLFLLPLRLSRLALLGSARHWNVPGWFMNQYMYGCWEVGVGWQCAWFKGFRL